MVSETLPLPPPAFPALREGDLQTAPWEVDCYTAEQMLAYGDARAAQERARLRDFTMTIQPDMGVNLHCEIGGTVNPGDVFRCYKVEK